MVMMAPGAVLGADDTAPVIIVVTVTVDIVFADLVDVCWGEWRVSWGHMPWRWCRVMGNWEHVLKVTWREEGEDREGKKARGDRRKKGKGGGGKGRLSQSGPQTLSGNRFFPAHATTAAVQGPVRRAGLRPRRDLVFRMTSQRFHSRKIRLKGTRSRRHDLSPSSFLPFSLNPLPPHSLTHKINADSQSLGHKGPR